MCTRRPGFKAIVFSQLDILRRDLRCTFRLLRRFPHLTAAVGVTSFAAVQRRHEVGIEPLDPWIFGGAIILVAMAAGVATLIPALRVARVDPSRVLNSN